MTWCGTQAPFSPNAEAEPVKWTPTLEQIEQRLSRVETAINAKLDTTLLLMERLQKLEETKANKRRKVPAVQH
jgi:hypothetical protein